MANDYFDSFQSFADHLTVAVVPNIPTAMREGLNEVGEEIVKVAKAKFGVYQSAKYKYPKWAPLSPATIANGNPSDTPLLRTGNTRDSIYHSINGDDLIVGATEQTMIYHELGTKNEPPRPVLGPAVYELRDTIKEIMGRATAIALVPGLKMNKLYGFKRTGAKLGSERYSDYKGSED